MNYIAEIKAFYDLVQVKQLSQGQIAVWHAVMYINNKCAWIEWFSVPNITLELNTGLSRSGIAKARNALKQYGLIDFKQNSTKATTYKMFTMLKSEQVSNQIDNTMSKSNQIPANQQPDMPVPYVNLSYIYAQTWNIKGGIMYRIFKSAPRYAFKQLKYDGILEKNIDPSRIVTGKEAVEIFNKCKIKYGNQNK